jgi:hypothetical protein
MKSWRNHWPALWLLLILIFVVMVRSRLLAMPLERDEGEYAYAGQLILEGEPPYKLVYNMKMPGIYATYALIMGVFGQSASGIHLGFMLVNLGAIVLVYFIGLRFFDRAGAIAASGIYALLSLSPRVQGLNAHATHFVVCAALGGILALLRGQASGRLAAFFWSGLLFGVAFLMKQPGGAFAVFGFSVLLWSAWRQQPLDWRTHAWRLAVYSFGVILPLVLTCLVLWRVGVWGKFWFWTVVYARVHATAVSWSDGMPVLIDYIKNVHWDGAFWALALVGMVVALIDKRQKAERFFFLSFLFLSAAAVCPSWHFSGHYFVLMLPVAALLGAKAVTVAAAWAASRPQALVRRAPWIFLGLVWFGVAWSHRDIFFEWGPEEAAQRLYPDNDFYVYPVIADYLRAHSPPSATFAVLGSEPELLFYAHRRSVTGYIYMYDLVEPHAFRERMEKEMIAEVEKGHPDFIICVNMLFSWNPFPPENMQVIQKWMTQYTASQYDPYGVVTLPPSQYCFRPDCLKLVPPNRWFVTIFQRKQTAPNLPKSAS